MLLRARGELCYCVRGVSCATALILCIYFIARVESAKHFASLVVLIRGL